MWKLVDTLSAMLDPGEQEAVLGDLAESGETGSKALREVLGLVVRRQVAVWTAWRPWLTLTILLIPLGIFLSVLSRSTADESAVYTWMYANNWDWKLLINPGFWYVLSESATLVFAGWLTLACWSWTAGFVIGYFSRGIARINGVLFLLMLAVGETVGAPLYMVYSLQQLHRSLHLPALPDPNGAVFTLTFYSAIFPVIIQVMLVAAPAIYGMRQGIQTLGLPRLHRVILLTASALTLAVIMIQPPGLVFLLSPNSQQWIWRVRQIIRVMQFVAYWPALYLIAMAVKHRSLRLVTVH